MEIISFKPLLGSAMGASFGYLYYKFVGCRSGVCPLTSNPYISTFYGMMVGYFMMSK
jgi:hypothetical protein